MSVPQDEAAQRRALAAVHRIVARHRWDDLVFNLFTARVPGAPEHLLVTPFPTLASNARASDMVKVDLDGKPVNGGRIDIDGFPLYGAIHKARPDVTCVLHVHTTAGVAVSAMADGLLPLSQTAMLVYDDIAYCDYAGIGKGDDEAVDALADKNNLILRNHGTVSVGRTVAEAWGRLHVLEAACAIQVAAMSSNAELTSVKRKVVSSVAQMGTAYLGSGVIDDAWDNMVALIEREQPDYAQ